MRPPIGNTGISERVFQKLYLDYLRPYPRSRSGNIGIFVAVDHLSKFPFLKTVKNGTVESVVKFMEEELFHCFGVPETVVSDNGVQFKSKMFNDLLKKYNVKHVYTAFYSPQANASERGNRSVLAAIKAYIQPDQKNWDEHLSSSCCALRSSLHSAIGTSPYRVAFGQHMVTDGGNYQLLRQLKLLDDRTACFSKEDSFELIRKKANVQIVNERTQNGKSYNLRSRNVNYKIGQEVYRRNFTQSYFTTGYSAKLAPSFLKARVKRNLGNYYYEFEDLQGRVIGKFHAKDIRQ